MDNGAGNWAFDTATAVRRDGGGWAGEIVAGWDINGNANGGYLLALAASALRAACGRPDPVTLTAHYLAPGLAGPVTFDTATVKEGRRFATVTGSMRWGDRELMRLLGAFGDLGEGDPSAPRLIHGAPPDLPPMEECVPRPVSNGGGVEITLMQHLDVRLHPDDAGFQEARPSGRGVVRGWFSFADGRPIDTLALLLAADAFPPSVFNMEGLPPGWVPTVELTVHVRAVPAPGPLRCRFQTRFVADGAMEEDSELWDSQGRLVALSRQYGLLARA